MLLRAALPTPRGYIMDSNGSAELIRECRRQLVRREVRPFEVGVEQHHELLPEHATDFADQRVLSAAQRPDKGTFPIGDEVNERRWTLEVRVGLSSGADFSAYV